jgi:hypothetical protein
MRTRCSEGARPAQLAAWALALIALPASADQAAGASGLPSTAEQFVARLLMVADARAPADVPSDFDRAFGVELALHTRVLVSGSLEGDSKHGVTRFVRLGDEWYPLSFGASGACLTYGTLEPLLKADGWEGGAAQAPARPGERWLYRKARTQLLAEAARDTDPATAVDCIGSILISFR